MKKACVVLAIDKIDTESNQAAKNRIIQDIKATKRSEVRVIDIRRMLASGALITEIDTALEVLDSQIDSGIDEKLYLYEKIRKLQKELIEKDSGFNRSEVLLKVI